MPDAWDASYHAYAEAGEKAHCRRKARKEVLLLAAYVLTVVLQCGGELARDGLWWVIIVPPRFGKEGRRAARVSEEHDRGRAHDGTEDRFDGAWAAAQRYEYAGFARLLPQAGYPLV